MYLDVEQVRHGPLVFHVPPRSECLRKRSVERLGRGVAMQNEQVVDVASKDELLVRRARA
eukprot:6163538-Pleurochrysis_carterae.AAC.2